METQSIPWDDQAKRHFDNVISNLPQFHRTIAEKLVKETSEELARTRSAACVEERDVVTAFFQEVPPAFKDMMKRLLTQQGIAYTHYIKE